MGFSDLNIPKSSLKQAYKERNSTGGGSDIKVEPGKYECALVNMKSVKSGKKSFVVFENKIGGEDLEDESYRGGVLSQWFSFEDTRAKFLYQALKKYGVDVKDDSPEALIEALEELEGELPVANILTVKQGKEEDQQNVYIDRATPDIDPSELNYEGEDEDEDGPNLDEMDRKELKALVKAEGLDIKITRKLTDDKLRELIEEALDEEEDEEDEDEEDEEDED